MQSFPDIVHEMLPETKRAIRKAVKNAMKRNADKAGAVRNE